MPTDQPHDQADSALTRDASPGDMLQRARIEKDRDEKWVADRLHITVHYVKAIEGDKYEKLPGIVFAKGYLKSYAKLVGLDPEAVLGAFEAMQSDREEIKNQAQVSQAKMTRDRNTRWAAVSVVSLVLLIGGALYFSGPDSVDSASTEAPAAEPADDDLQETPRQEIQQSSVPTPEQPLARPEPGDGATMAAAETAAPAEDVADSAQVGVSVAGQESREPGIVQEEERVVQSAVDLAEADQVDDETETAAQTTATVTQESSSEPVAGNLLADLVASAESDSSSDSEPRPEELANINVLEGENGERIIAVDAQGEDLLRISFSGESWVEINDGDDRQIYRDLREQGDVLEVSGHAPFNVLLGDAPLTQLNFNGADIDVTGNIRIDNSARLTVGL